MPKAPKALKTVFADAVMPIEWNSEITADVVLPIEWLATLDSVRRRFDAAAERYAGYVAYRSVAEDAEAPGGIRYSWVARYPLSLADQEFATLSELAGGILKRAGVPMDLSPDVGPQARFLMFLAGRVPTYPVKRNVMTYEASKQLRQDCMMRLSLGGFSVMAVALQALIEEWRNATSPGTSREVASGTGISDRVVVDVVRPSPPTQDTPVDSTALNKWLALEGGECMELAGRGQLAEALDRGYEAVRVGYEWTSIRLGWLVQLPPKPKSMPELMAMFETVRRSDRRLEVAHVPTSPSTHKSQEPKPFSAGEMVFFEDRVELCGADICSGKRSQTRRKLLNLLRKKSRDGRFAAYGSEELAKELKRRGGRRWGFCGFLGQFEEHKIVHFGSKALFFAKLVNLLAVLLVAKVRSNVGGNAV